MTYDFMRDHVLARLYNLLNEQDLSTLMQIKGMLETVQMEYTPKNMLEIIERFKKTGKKTIGQPETPKGHPCSYDTLRGDCWSEYQRHKEMKYKMLAKMTGTEFEDIYPEAYSYNKKILKKESKADAAKRIILQGLMALMI